MYESEMQNFKELYEGKKMNSTSNYVIRNKMICITKTVIKKINTGDLTVALEFDLEILGDSLLNERSLSNVEVCI